MGEQLLFGQLADRFEQPEPLVVDADDERRIEQTTQRVAGVVSQRDRAGGVEVEASAHAQALEHLAVDRRDRFEARAKGGGDRAVSLCRVALGELKRRRVMLDSGGEASDRGRAQL